jgi:hypothetical protein
MNIRWRAWNLGVAVACAVVAGLAAVGTPRAAESDESREIKAAFRRNVEKIKSLDVSYHLDTTTDLTPDQLLSIPEYRNQMFLPKDEWRTAFSGAKRYQRHIQPKKVKPLVKLDEYGGFPPPEPRADDPPAIRENQERLRAEYDRMIADVKQKEASGIPIDKPKARDVMSVEPDVTYGYNGRAAWRKKPGKPNSDSYLVWPSGKPANWFQGTGYLAAIGLHQPDPTGMPEAKKSQAMFQLAELINNGTYELEPKSEVVDGSTCVILAGNPSSLVEPGLGIGKLTDRIWLDRDHGLVLRKREMAADGKVAWRWTTTDLKEIEPGIWFPMSTRNEQFPNGAPGPGDKPAMVEAIKVKSLTINHVPDALFDMTPRQGDRIEDLRGKL